MGGSMRATSENSMPASRGGHAAARIRKRCWLSGNSCRPVLLCCCAGRSTRYRSCSSTSASSVPSRTLRCSYEAYSLRFMQFSRRSRVNPNMATRRSRSCGANGAVCTGSKGVLWQMRSRMSSKRLSTAIHAYRSPRGHVHWCML